MSLWTEELVWVVISGHERPQTYRTPLIERCAIAQAVLSDQRRPKRQCHRALTLRWMTRLYTRSRRSPATMSDYPPTREPPALERAQTTPAWLKLVDDPEAGASLETAQRSICACRPLIYAHWSGHGARTRGGAWAGAMQS